MKTKYQVFDNNRSADEIGVPKLKGHGWTNSIFNTYQEAFDYAIKWLGEYSNGLKQEDLPVNIAYDYNGYGDMIEIREIKS